MGCLRTINSAAALQSNRPAERQPRPAPPRRPKPRARGGARRADKLVDRRHYGGMRHPAALPRLASPGGAGRVTVLTGPARPGRGEL